MTKGNYRDLLWQLAVLALLLLGGFVWAFTILGKVLWRAWLAID